MFNEKKIRVAILDMNEGLPNQGMRCIREILDQYRSKSNQDLHWDEFEVRVHKQVPDMNYDIYISSGGPGSPLESEGSEWEEKYFNWLQQVEQWNNDVHQPIKKYVFFICHSYQLVCRHYKIAQVVKRRSTAFGVFPIHLVRDGKHEVVFHGLRDPFYAVDSRDYQVIQPDQNKLYQFGAKILAIEKERPHVPLERAIMAIRFNEYMIGTQFHPEADATGMSMYLQREDKKQTVISNYGEAKWKSMIEQLNDPDKIMWTNIHVLPNFLHIATEHLQEMEVG
ncbi:MAG: GMP synthase [Bacteroidetes bacterium]|nr:GMP synthase [Bacteroidota bacterium]MBS1932582.1 GMP synthase [Bacteroidota bacterium]